MKYTVTIEETVSDTFEIEANSLEEAEEVARQKYNDGDILLEPGNVTSKQMEVCCDEAHECSDWISL